MSRTVSDMVDAVRREMETSPITALVILATRGANNSRYFIEVRLDINQGGALIVESGAPGVPARDIALFRNQLAERLSEFVSSVSAPSIPGFAVIGDEGATYR